MKCFTYLDMLLFFIYIHRLAVDKQGDFIITHLKLIVCGIVTLMGLQDEVFLPF